MNELFVLTVEMIKSCLQKPKKSIQRTFIPKKPACLLGNTLQ